MEKGGGGQYEEEEEEEEEGWWGGIGGSGCDIGDQERSLGIEVWSQKIVSQTEDYI